MATVFSHYNELLAGKRWSLRFWDGRPTGFLPVEEYTDLFQQAIDENDIPALNVLLDEIDPEVMELVANQVMELATPELLQWYVTTTYPPLLTTFTPERFLDSDDLQDALVSYPQNLYRLMSWWLTLPYGKEALTILRNSFLPGTLDEARSGPLNTSMEEWRRQKKLRFLQDRAAAGYQNPATTFGENETVNSPSPPRSIRAAISMSTGKVGPPIAPQRRPRAIPPRQGPSSPAPAAVNSSASASSYRPKEPALRYRW